MSQKLAELIKSTPLIGDEDKNFLLRKLVDLNPIEILKLEKSLITGTVSPLLEQIQSLKGKNKNQKSTSETNKEDSPEEGKKVLSISILTQTSYLGGNIPRVVKGEGVPPLANLTVFEHPAQLSQLSPQHVTFGMNDNAEQIIRIFLEKVEKIFLKIDDIQVRRNYFMNFIQSNLFTNYLNTGLTALRHPEIEPAKVILNTLHQINSAYLNNNQFQYAAVICNHIRGLCAV